MYVVDNVNKIINQKEIGTKQKGRQKDELLAFKKKHQSNHHVFYFKKTYFPASFQ